MRPLLFLLAISLLLGCSKSKESNPDTTPNPQPNTQSQNTPGDSVPKPPSVSREPVAKLTAIALFNEYQTNPLGADKKYKDRPVEISGHGSVKRDEDGRYYFGFTIIVFPGMTQAQLAQLSPRERQWFRDGAYPPNVVAYLNAKGEKAAAEYKPGETIRVTGFVRGTKTAEAWRDFVVELDDCDLKPVEKIIPPKKETPPKKEEPKKEEKPRFDPGQKETYSEKATVKQWSGKRFINPVENVPAHKKEINGKLVIYTRPPADNADSTIGTEITLADGTYVVTKVVKGDPFRINYVKKKEEKKP